MPRRALQGQAGPPLAGPKFAANLRYSKMSAQQMFTFIKTQMPANKPASLTKQQYLQSLAYILSKNGYPAGATPLSEKTLGQVKLLPYPVRAARNRIVRRAYNRIRSSRRGGTTQELPRS